MPGKGREPPPNRKRCASEGTPRSERHLVEIARLSKRVIFQKPCYPTLWCRRPVKMSPLCQLEMTLPRGFSGGVRGDGSADERRGAGAGRRLPAAAHGAGSRDRRAGLGSAVVRRAHPWFGLPPLKVPGRHCAAAISRRRAPATAKSSVVVSSIRSRGSSTCSGRIQLPPSNARYAASASSFRQISDIGTSAISEAFYHIWPGIAAKNHNRLTTPRFIRKRRSRPAASLTVASR